MYIETEREVLFFTFRSFQNIPVIKNKKESNKIYIVVCLVVYIKLRSYCVIDKPLMTNPSTSSTKTACQQNRNTPSPP